MADTTDTTDATGGDNLIINGSFEDLESGGRGRHHHRHHHHRHGAELAGWQISDGPGPDILGDPWRPAADGRRFIELDGRGGRDTNSGIHQDVPTNGASTFVLSFSYAAPRFSRESSNGIQVVWDGQVIDTISADGGWRLDWQTYTYELPGGGDLTRLEFRAVGRDDGRGGYLDNVSLVAADPPPLFTDGDDTVDLAADDPDYGAGEAYDALGGDDVVTGGDQADVIDGGTGNDTLSGGGGDDVLIGGADGEVLVERERTTEHDLSGLTETPAPGVDPAHFQLAADHAVSLSFAGEDAAYRNTVGVYKIGPDGEITDVRIVFADASESRWGGTDVGETVDLDLVAGDSFGVFLVADGADRNSFRRFDDGHFEFRNADGTAATLDSDAPELVFVDDRGRAKELKGEVYHSAAVGSHLALNADDEVHVVSSLNDDGGLRLGFEDLRIGDTGRSRGRHGAEGGEGGEGGRSDEDFNDVVLDLSFAPVVETYTEVAADNDVLDGGDGHDTLIGGFGDDVLVGGAGKDTLDGGAGADELRGNGGNDVIYGRAGKDTISGGGGDDDLRGGGGTDLIKGGNGDDVLRGGGGDDDLRGGAGDDLIIGGVGADGIDGGGGDDTVRLDVGDAGDATDPETADGGVGIDTLEITVTTDQLADAAVVQALVDLSSFVLANADASSDAGPIGAFAALGLEVRNFEAITVTVIDSETGEELPGFITPEITLNADPASGDEDTAIVLNITAAVTNAPDLFDVAVTVAGLPAGAVLSAGTDNGDGSYTVTAGDLAGLAVTPPADSDADFDLTLAAVATSRITGLVTEGVPLALPVAVHAVADAPMLSVDDVTLVDAGAGDDVIDGTDGKDTLQGFGGNDTITGGAGGDTIIGDGGAVFLTGALAISAALGDLDGSESLVVTVDGLPAGAVLSAGTPIGSGSVSLDPTDLAGLQITVPATAGNFQLTVTATATDTDADDGSQSIATAGVVVQTTLVVSVDGDDLLIGGAGKDDIQGGGGNDVILGDGGADTLAGEAGDDTINGGAGADVILGGAGADTIDGDGGDDVIDGGEGDDIIDGSGGDDVIAGGAGNDTINGGGGFDRLDGGDGDDVIKGGAADDTLFGGAGNDELKGNGGSDYLDGGDGDDTLSGADLDDMLLGGAGNDYLKGNAGNDVLDGGAGDDVLEGRQDDDTISGGLGRDTILAGGGNDWADGGADDDTIDGAAGADTLFGGAGADILNGDGGSDTLFGGDGADTVNGGVGADTLDGGTGDDILNGDDGNDVIDGGDGWDTITGGLGKDTIAGGDGRDYIYGGDGNDSISGGAFDDRLWGEAGNDTLIGDSGIDILYGGDGRDVLYGGDDNDTLRGEADNDQIFGEAGNDILIGAEGKDTLWGGIGNDLLIGEEGADLLYGGDGNDNILGGGGGDLLDGGGGDDLLRGEAGADRFVGGAGVDVMVGKGGGDTFVFDLAAVPMESGIGAGNRDVIEDFDADGDVIEFTGAVSFNFVGDETQDFAGGGASGRFNSQTKVLEIDADGDQQADMEVELRGVDGADLDDTDFTVT